jgi:hypothetical protein
MRGRGSLDASKVTFAAIPGTTPIIHPGCEVADGYIATELTGRSAVLALLSRLGGQLGMRDCADCGRDQMIWACPARR